MTDKSKILDRIRKCLALGKSANENEAATALRQARKLMDQHGLTEADVDTAQVTQWVGEIGRRNQPPLWLHRLALVIADTWDCVLIYDQGTPTHYGLVRFIGVGAKPELAAYTWQVLSRLLERSRAAHVRGLRKGLKRQTKVRRGDLYAKGWTYAVYEKVADLAGNNEKDKALIDAWLRQQGVRTQKTAARDTGKGLRQHDTGSFVAGRSDGSQVQLYRPIQESGRQQSLPRR